LLSSTGQVSGLIHPHGVKLSPVFEVNSRTPLCRVPFLWFSMRPLYLHFDLIALFLLRNTNNASDRQDQHLNICSPVLVYSMVNYFPVISASPNLDDSSGLVSMPIEKLSSLNRFIYPSL